MKDFLLQELKNALDFGTEQIDTNVTINNNFNNTIRKIVTKNFINNRCKIFRLNLFEQAIQSYSSTLRYLKRYSSKAEETLNKVKNMDYIEGSSLFTVGTINYFFIKKNIIVIELDSNQMVYVLKITTIGKDSIRLMKYILRFQRKYYRKEKFPLMNLNNAYLYHLDKYGGNIGLKEVSSLNTIDEIISPNKEELVASIDLFLKRSKLYKKYHKTYKYNILLSGKPGTGKTTIVKALANYYNASLYIITSTSNFIDFIEDKENKFAEKNRLNIYLWEDIDNIFSTDDKSHESTITKEQKIDFVMQYLDGAHSIDNSINILTTNYPEKLDERLVRKGRIDKHIIMEDFDHEHAIKLCEKFEIRDNVDQFLYNFNHNQSTYNPAELENYILDNIKIM